MKTTVTLIAAYSAFTVGAIAAPIQSATAEEMNAVEQKEKKTVLRVSGMR